MTWHYAVRDWRIAEVFEDLDPDTLDDGASEAYCVLGWRDLPHILRDIRWVIKDIRYDLHRHWKCPHCGNRDPNHLDKCPFANEHGGIAIEPSL